MYVSLKLIEYTCTTKSTWTLVSVVSRPMMRTRCAEAWRLYTCAWSGTVRTHSGARSFWSSIPKSRKCTTPAWSHIQVYFNCIDKNQTVDKMSYWFLLGKWRILNGQKLWAARYDVNWFIFPGHEIAKKQMSGFSGMIAFEMKGGFEAAKTVVQVGSHHCTFNKRSYICI